MSRDLFMYLRGYSGVCEVCGAVMSADILAVHDMRQQDSYGNRVFFVLGIPTEYGISISGDDFICGNCVLKFTFSDFTKAQIFLSAYRKRRLHNETGYRMQ